MTISNTSMPLGGCPLRHFFKVLLLCFFIFSSLSCATSFDSRGRYHKVMKGDTLDSIARFYGVSVQETAELNNIEKANGVEVGSKIYIPEKHKKPGYKKLPFGKYLTAEKKQRKSGRRMFKREVEKYEGDNIRVDHGRFTWPVDGKISSMFGIRNGRRHDGIDIAAKNGTPIRAAGSGKIVFSGKMKGYGNLVIIRHKDDFFTVYAHNDKNKVKKGDSVRDRQLIATVGRTGRATGPHLHFEVRNGQKARNPLFFLPRKSSSQFAKK